jgi:hypothetical protein
MLQEDLELYGHRQEVEAVSGGGRYKFQNMYPHWTPAERAYATADECREAIRQQYRDEIAKLRGKIETLEERLAGEIVVME